MGQPVVHFEIVGKDAKKLREFYGDLAGWKFEVFDGGPTDYGVVLARRATPTPRVSGSAEASATAPRATRATSPSTSRCPTSVQPSTRPSRSAARR